MYYYLNLTVFQKLYWYVVLYRQNNIILNQLSPRCCSCSFCGVRSFFVSISKIADISCSRRVDTIVVIFCRVHFQRDDGITR